MTSDHDNLRTGFRKVAKGRPPDDVLVRVAGGPDALRFCALPPGAVVVVGRDPACGLVLSDASASRRHISLRYDPAADAVEVTDLGATNGTEIGGEPLVGTRWASVGDRIGVGRKTSLQLERLSPAEIADLAGVAQQLTTAQKDGLTQVWNRGWLDASLPELVAQHQAARAPLALVFVDLDHFSRLNATLGLGAGDAVLERVAAALVAGSRGTDEVIRYAGEEFLVVLPRCDLRGALSAAERLRARVAELPLNDLAPKLALTASLGVALHKRDEPILDWVRRADQAMLRAKSAGRNIVAMATDTVNYDTLR